MATERVCQVRGGEIIKSFVSDEERIGVDLVDWEQVKVLQDWCDVFSGARVGKLPSSCVLNVL